MENEQARFTNSLHMQLFSLLEDARDIADAGMEENLDPECVAIFRAVEDFAAETQAQITAEIAAHVEDGKWG
jgi:hypothetical protein